MFAFRLDSLLLWSSSTILRNSLIVERHSACSGAESGAEPTLCFVHMLSQVEEEEMTGKNRKYSGRRRVRSLVQPHGGVGGPRQFPGRRVQLLSGSEL